MSTRAEERNTPSLFTSDHPDDLDARAPSIPRYAARSCIRDVPETPCILIGLFQRARRDLATRTLLDNQSSSSLEARPRPDSATTTSPQLQPIWEAPAGRRRTRQSRSTAYYDPPRTFLHFRGLILSLFLHRQSFLCSVLPALALPRLPVTLLKASLIIRLGMRGYPRTQPSSLQPYFFVALFANSVDGVSSFFSSRHRGLAHRHAPRKRRTGRPFRPLKESCCAEFPPHSETPNAE